MSCACMGPQNGEPLCPCRMRAVARMNSQMLSDALIVTTGAARVPDLEKRITDLEAALRAIIDTDGVAIFSAHSAGPHTSHALNDMAREALKI